MRSTRGASAPASASPRWRGTATGTWSSTTPSPARAPSSIPSIRGCIPDQIAWIVNHAEDTCLFFDLTFLPIVEKIAAQLQDGQVHRRHDRPCAHAGEHRAFPNLLCYEELLGGATRQTTTGRCSTRISASSICYTSGTTGNPKGVLYSHRSTLLHTFAAALPDTLNISGKDVILPVVPMFHVNAWGIPYAGAMVGAKLVFPGAGARRQVGATN